jgi:hypothetical protein
MPEEFPHRDGKRHQIFLAASNPDERSFGVSFHLIIPEKE